MSEDNSRRHHRGRGRPPGLRGRDIGMYYASKQRVKEEAHHHHHQLPLVTIDPGQKHAIQRLLGHFQDQGSQPKESQRSGRPRFLDEYHRHLQANTHKEDMKQSNRDLLQTQGSSIVEDFSDLDEILLEKHRQMLKDQNYLRMLEFREKLPAFEKREALVNVIRSNRVVVISGETGCGKTTQVPQFILDDAVARGDGGRTRIICTQPRRISAITIAERVADERGETCGGADASVGYQIRLESRVPRDRGSILYCTTGVVLQWMRTNKTLQGISHIILDEIHERDILSDFLITLLRDLVQAERKDLTVVLMSATLNAHQFSKYFFNCPTINIPGFTFPVKEFYLEDVLEVTKFRIESNRSIRSQQSMEKWRKYTVQGKAEMRKNKDFEDFIDPYLRDLANQRSYSTATIESLSHQESEEINFELIATLVRHIHQREDEGAILIFLPGWDDISKVFKLLTEDPRYRLSGSSVRIYPLHSLMPTIEQKAIFTRPPSGIRKIVIATNIAETSITIDDIVYVVDCGKIKMSNFDVESNLATLKPEWVSLANARQRRGRAGRVRPGICYHLYTRAREMILEQFVLPEILRTRLEEVILHIKSLELGLANSFLAKLMNPPEEKAINLALELLRNINALYPSFENLTPLGYHLSRLPMDPQTGKMILFGAIFSCLDPVLTVASSLSFKDPFVIPLGKEELADRRKRFLSADTKSDHLMLVNVVTEWEEEVRHGRGSAYCWDNFLSESTLRMLSNMKRQFAEHLFEMKFLESKDVKDISSNRNSDNEALVRAVICAGLYPNVAQIRIRRNKRRGAFVNLSTRTERKVSIHPKSVNAKETDFRYPWMVYHQMMKSSSVFIHDCSMVSPLALIFFGKQVAWGHRDARYGGEEIIVDSFVKFGCGTGTGDLVQDLRLALDNYLEHKVTHPSSTNWRKGSRETDLLNAIIGLLTYELEAIEAENDEDEYY